jgi:hypothetical protein
MDFQKTQILSNEKKFWLFFGLPQLSEDVPDMSSI